MVYMNNNKNTDNTIKKVKAILANLDIDSNDPRFNDLLNQGVAAKEYGLTYKAIYSILEERLG